MGLGRGGGELEKGCGSRVPCVLLTLLAVTRSREGEGEGDWGRGGGGVVLGLHVFN